MNFNRFGQQKSLKGSLTFHLKGGQASRLAVGYRQIAAVIALALMAGGVLVQGVLLPVANAQVQQDPPTGSETPAIPIEKTCEERSSLGGKEIVTKTERATYKEREAVVKTVDNKSELYLDGLLVDVVQDPTSGKYQTYQLPFSDGYVSLWDLAKDMIDLKVAVPQDRPKLESKS